MITTASSLSLLIFFISDFFVVTAHEKIAPTQQLSKLHHRHFNPHRKVRIASNGNAVNGHPGWFYYNLILSPTGEGCDLERTIAMQYGYQQNTCLVIYDDASNNDDADNNFASSSIMFSCTDDGDAVQTTYTDTNCETLDATTTLGTVGQCTATDSLFTNFIQYFCTEPEVKFPVATRRDYAILNEYNTTTCHSLRYLTAVTSIRTEFCILPEDVNSDYRSAYISDGLTATYYSDTSCFADPVSEKLKQSCSAVEIDDDADHIEVGQSQRWRISSDGDADDDGDDDYIVVDDATDDEVNFCFSSDTMVTLASGEDARIDSLHVGQRILVQQSTGEFSFANIIFVPHGPNAYNANFVEIITSTGRILTATTGHLVLTAFSICNERSKNNLSRQCQQEQLKEIQFIQKNDRVVTVNGLEEVTDVRRISKNGVYTVVTDDMYGHIVVNGIVASSFGTIHWLPNAYYTLHRLLYHYVLPIHWMESKTFSSLSLFVGTIAADSWTKWKKWSVV